MVGVILLVRMWVEKFYAAYTLYHALSSSLWGCERMWVEKSLAVSNQWSVASSSLWGCELKNCRFSLFSLFALSSSLWGCELKNILHIGFSHHCMSSSLWGCELKSRCKAWVESTPCHPPCEDVSWKSVPSPNFPSPSVILLVRMWVEKYRFRTS